MYSLLRFIRADFSCAVEQVQAAPRARACVPAHKLTRTGSRYRPMFDGLTRGLAPCTLPGSSYSSLNATVAFATFVTLHQTDNFAPISGGGE